MARGSTLFAEICSVSPLHDLPHTNLLCGGRQHSQVLGARHAPLPRRDPRRAGGRSLPEDRPSLTTGTKGDGADRMGVQGPLNRRASEAAAHYADAISNARRSTRSLKRWSMCGGASGCRLDTALSRLSDCHRKASLTLTASTNFESPQGVPQATILKYHNRTSRYRLGAHIRCPCEGVRLEPLGP